MIAADPAANRKRIAEAVALARASDVAIVVVGDNEQTAREAYAENHLGDRAGACAWLDNKKTLCERCSIPASRP